MRIALNLLYVIPGVVGGTQTYAQGLIQGLAAVDNRNEYLMYVSREAAELPLTEAPNFRRVVCPVNAASRANRYLYEQVVLPVVSRRDGVDIMHSLGYVGPIAGGRRHVVTIYDVNYIGHGAMMSAGRRRLLASLVPRVARSAACVTTTSEFSRSEIVRHMGIPSDKIVVTHAGGPRAGQGTPNREAAGNFAISEPYLVAVSGTLPHKNIARLVDAFGSVADQIPHRLVLIGHPTDGMDFQRQAAQLGVADRLLMTGYVPDECMMSLLGGADLFVFPSLYEGFGLPVLEAQAAGVPVICSNAGSLPEVAGDGAEFFNPVSVEEMASMIVRLVRDSQQRTHLAVRGAANFRRFSWEKTARVTLEVYHRVGNRESAPA